MVAGAQFETTHRECRAMSYEAGYNAAYAEICKAMDDPDHPRHWEDCRPCEVLKSVIGWTMQGLSPLMSKDDFSTLTRILADARDRRLQETGE